MKKSVLHLIKGTLVKAIVFAFSLPVPAQVSNPYTWSSFVYGSGNSLVSDTFRIQTFGDSEKDNWTYKTEGETSLYNASQENGDMCLKMLSDSYIQFEPYSLVQYENVEIKVWHSGQKLTSKDKLTATFHRSDSLISGLMYPSPNNQPPAYKFNPLFFKRNPFSLKISTSPATETNFTGYYCIDYVIAYGNIRQYSLFTGNGNWNDTIRWSHLPALRNRSALINGIMTVNTDSRCDQLSLSQSGLKIASGVHLTVNNLILHELDNTFTSNGVLTVNNCITLNKTFSEKGKWYFISFPFDVYTNGVDTRFQQKDDKLNNGGNYFYIQTYNGEKRATNNNASGNWEVLPVSSPQSKVPLFQKNKGYLIAIDAKATIQTLIFSSRPGEIPTDFAQKGSASIFAPIPIVRATEINNGWYFCGNPLPSPLSFSQIEPNPALDGYIYIYEGPEGYKAYPIGSDYTIPPFAAFFVKATSDTELKVSNATPSGREMLLNTSMPLHTLKAEPGIRTDTPTTTSPKIGQPNYQIRDKQLYLENMPVSGFMQLTDITGRYIDRQFFHSGSSVIQLTASPGIYIIGVEAGLYKNRQKLSIGKFY